ncbi:hypothetical protein PV10_07268 [Exophiala mesophila]|uniref:Uncharacterized protein n=1 Tax=Exophiala mesophila TaxID=212818 RepID=A0A0D1Z7I6_EXOME|nr:uncharacterized protein PV10_07268 [Exophiala mesophila]KIV89909.1 hypothetical protein PV10_07268 [Exophiala mesophila]
MHRPKSFRLSLTSFEKLRHRKKTTEKSNEEESACNKRWSDLYQTHATACKQASEQPPSDKELSPPPLVEVHRISLVVDLSDCDHLSECDRASSSYSSHTQRPPASEPPTSSPICCQMYLLRNDISNSDDLYFLPSPIQICDACDLADIKENLKYAGIHEHSAIHNWL